MFELPNLDAAPSHVAKPQPFVRIHGERGRQYVEWIGTNLLPIVSPDALIGQLPGLGLHPVWILDAKRLDPRVRQRIAAAMAEKFGLSVEEVLADIDNGRSPIRVL